MPMVEAAVAVEVGVVVRFLVGSAVAGLAVVAAVLHGSKTYLALSPG